MAKLSKTKVKNLILDYLKRKVGLTVKTEESGNGYFLFEFGPNSVFHFTFNEIRGWKFGLWLRWDDDEKKTIRVEFFGDKINWINKFKPTQTPIANSIVISSYKDLDDFEKMYELFHYSTENYDSDGDVIRWLRLLKRYRHMTEYFLYGETNRSFIKWLWDEFKFYDVQKPIEDFYERSVVGKLYKVALWILGLKYRKYVIVRPIIDGRDEYLYVSPRYDTGVEYRPGLDEGTIKKIWYEIEDSKIVKFLSTHSNFNQYSDSEAKRGFYYPEYYEEKRKREDEEREKRLEKLKQNAK